MIPRKLQKSSSAFAAEKSIIYDATTDRPHADRRGVIVDESIVVSTLAAPRSIDLSSRRAAWRGVAAWRAVELRMARRVSGVTRPDPVRC